MRMSSKFGAPSAVAFLSVALLSIILLCGPAMGQAATGSAVLPSVTVDAPTHAAKPKHVAHAATSRRTSSAIRTSSATGQSSGTQSSGARTPSAAPNSVLGRIAKLESVASNCNGGCESSFRHGKDPWVGCSESGGGAANAPFSPTCRDSLTYKSYEDCVETKVFLGDYRNRAYWICSSLSAGNKFQVAELKRPRRSR